MEKKPFSEEQKEKLRKNDFILIDDYTATFPMKGKVHELSGATKNSVVFHSLTKIPALGQQYEAYPVFLEELEITDYMNISDSFINSKSSYHSDFDFSLIIAVEMIKNHLDCNQEPQEDPDDD